MKLKTILEGRFSHEIRRIEPPKGYELGKVIQGKRLARGMKVAASYDQTNQGTDFVEILGVTGNDETHSEQVKYNSVMEALRANNVRTLAELEQIDRQADKEKGYGHHHYLCVKDLKDGDTGCWYYLFRGRWARGSGAEKLSFRELRPANPEPELRHEKPLDTNASRQSAESSIDPGRLRGHQYPSR